MRTDQNVDLAGLKLLQNFLLLPGAAEPANHLDVYGKCGKPLLESLVMLKRQNSCRRQNRDLLVIADRLEGGAHRDFRFAVSDVAAKQAVHGLRHFHVALHVCNCKVLIFSLAVFEGVFEFPQPLIVLRKCMPLRRLPLCVQLQKLVSHVLHGLAHAGFGLGPLSSS